MMLGAMAMNGARRPSALAAGPGAKGLEASVRKLMDGIQGFLSGPGSTGPVSRRVRESLRDCGALRGADRADYLRQLHARLMGIVSDIRRSSWGGSPGGVGGTGLGLSGLPSGLSAADPTELVPPTRVSCLMCVEKHLGSAYVLMTETRHGYPHRMMAVGHLQEAEDESQEHAELHQAIRDARKAYQLQDVIPDWVKLRELHERALAAS